MSRESLGALVLAGGRSQRMGRDKATFVLATESVESETLLARTVRVTLEVAGDCVVVLAPAQAVDPHDPRAPSCAIPLPTKGRSRSAPCRAWTWAAFRVHSYAARKAIERGTTSRTVIRKGLNSEISNECQNPKLLRIMNRYAL